MRHRVLSVRPLSPLAYILRLERGRLEFQPGQYVRSGIPGLPAQREYSIFSAPGEACLEVLVREMREGLLSPRLRHCQPGDALELEEPFGEFFLPGGDQGGDPGGSFFFVATGTGIAPFHCFARSYPRLDYQLLHGVARAGELYGAKDFDPRRVTPCLSRERGTGFSGRVTDFLRQHSAEPKRLC